MDLDQEKGIGENSSISPWALILSCGLLGLGFQIHRVFTAASHEGIPLKTGMGFALGALVGGMVLFASRYLVPAIRRVARKAIVWTALISMFAATAYVATIVFRNTAALAPHTRLLPDVLVLYGVFLALSLVVFLVMKMTIRSTFAGASLAVFLLCAVGLLIQTATLTSAVWLLAYDLYLILLGRFIAGGLSRVLRLPFDSMLQRVLASFVLGILGHYLLWYGLGRLGLLYASTAYALALPVLIVGLFRYRRGLVYGARRVVTGGNRLFGDRLDPTAAVLTNLTLFCLLMLVLVLTVAYPGSSDSSARMYCATIYKFAELHRLVLPPFFQHWPLLLQPLLLEMTGLPLFMIGGITPLRFFHGSMYFSFIPFVVLFCRRYGLPMRTVVILVLVVVSSSESLRGAYTDKPEALAFPAFLSLLALCLAALKETRPWDVILIGALAAVISGTKPVLMIGVVICFGLVVAGRAFMGGGGRRSGLGKAVQVAAGVFLIIGSVHTVQNIVLRGNPFHPMAAGVFTGSQAYPEEVLFTKIPGQFYRRTMPIAAPSEVATINFEPSRAMYGPLLDGTSIPRVRHPKNPYRPQWGVTRKSISGAAVLLALLLPVILLIRTNRVMGFLVVLTFVSFFIWFGWIGDALRYSTFLPSLALLAAVVLGQPFLPGRLPDLVWRHAVIALLIVSIPVGLHYTFNDWYHVFDPYMRGTRAPRGSGSYSYLLERSERNRMLPPALNPVTTRLKEWPGARPVLLVDVGFKVDQFGLYQPNFLFKPLHWRKELITSMVYLAEIRPTHYLTAGMIQGGSLVTRYPQLADDLEWVEEFELGGKRVQLHRFREGTPWAEYLEQARLQETANPGHIAAIRRTLQGVRADIPR